MSAASIRARVRAEMTEEIKETARRHLAAEGANLSLRAVARDLGMVSSALYRYFASRDDLLTALIIDAYNAIGVEVERAAAAADGTDLLGRWLAICHSVRDWALANRHEYALIYGSPVPGYRAPADTIGPASRVTMALGALLRDGVASGALCPGPDEELPEPVRGELRAVAADAFPGVPAAVLARGMTAWLHLFGTVSFELFGQFNNVIEDRRAFFDDQVRRTGRYLGLPADAGPAS